MESRKDKPAPYTNYAIAFLAVMLAFVAIMMCMTWLVAMIPPDMQPSARTIRSLLLFIVYFALRSAYTQQNEVNVITFFGKYIGVIKKVGFAYTIPFTSHTPISLKSMIVVTDNMTVTHPDGSAVEIGAVVTWRVSNAAQAALKGVHYKTFVANQVGIAVRALAAQPYDATPSTLLLDNMAAQLTATLQQELCLAGITVDDAQIVHLARRA